MAVMVVLSAVSAGPVWSAEGVSEPLLGDESDGSRALALHLIPLFAENEDGEKGEQIDPTADDAMPFSTRHTCGECHTYEVINDGWHFNAVDPNVPPGRVGQPWLYFSAKLGVQIPLSYRSWPGAIHPNDVGFDPPEFTKIFGRHMPGGGPGEVPAPPGDMQAVAEQYLKGKLEVNCLACHNGHPGQDQGSPIGYAVQVSRENFRWAATASCEFAKVSGSVGAAPITYDPFMPGFDDEGAPEVTYDEGRFDDQDWVLVEVEREVPDHRCYFCHSNVYFTEGNEHGEKWIADEDVHLKAGLTCVDCHRNGMDHDMVRGYDLEDQVSDNPLAASTSCEGCHIGDEHGNRAEGGRLGAPVPEHAGIPPVHFERMTCTACHSGPWPADTTEFTKTSRAHRLGTPNVNKDPNALPHIVTPVFATQSLAARLRGENEAGASEIPADKIAPHKVVWPAYWGRMEDAETVKPLAIDVVEKTVGAVFEDVEVPQSGSWPELSDEHIVEALQALAPVADGNGVYVAGGQVYRLDGEGELQVEADHPAAAPYMWPLAHDVRPAAQSLGIRACTDCHATDKPFFFGDVAVDSPVVSATLTKEQIAFQAVGRAGAWAFAFSFVFRPWFKVVAIGAVAVIGIVLLLYGLKALGAVARVLAEQD